MLYQIVKLLSAFVCVLPFAFRNLLGNIIGRAGWLIAPSKRKRMAVFNVRQSLGVDEKKAKEIVRKSAVRFGPMFMEVLHMPRLNKDNIAKYVSLKGKENLANALAVGKGAVLITAHTGNWELLGAALAMHGFPLAAVVQKQSNLAMDKFINEYRAKAGMHVTYRTGVREMVRLLSEGMIVGLLIDQDAGRNGVFVDFFSRSASTAPGAAALARLKDAPIVPAFITYNGDGAHTAIIHPEIYLDKSDDRDADILFVTQKLTAIVENHIKEHAQEWFWLHNRWKTVKH